MNTTKSPRWSRPLPGWYTLTNLATATSATVIQNEIGLWDVKVNDRAVGMAKTLKSAKAIALAEMAA